MYKILAKLSFGAINLHFLPSCHSTNEIAQNMVKSGCRQGTMVITEDQFAGKGQGGNTWQSDTGQNLIFSLVLKPEFLPPKDQFLITMLISLALKNTLDEYLPGEVKVKWPNDIYYEDNKIAGILIENVLRGSNFDYCITGIGLNVNQQSFGGLARAISMKAILGKETDRNTLLNTLLTHIDEMYIMLKKGTKEKLREAYHANLLGRGEERAFRTEEVEFKGIIQSTDENGRLIIWSPQKTYRFNHKEVEMLF